MNSSGSELNELKGLGIFIEGGSAQKVSSRGECWLNVIAQFPDEGDDELNVMWFRSLFLTCISKANQAASSTNLIKSRVIFPGDFKKITTDTLMVQLTLRINLAKELDRKLVKDGYFVHISARQFLSNTVLVEVE